MYKIFLLLIPFILSQICWGQSGDQKIITKIGSEIITVSEFIERYELNPQTNAGIVGAEASIKPEILYSIIAEKLWAMDAEKMGIVKTRQFDFYFKPIEDLFVRDALFRQEIENKITVSKSELEKGINKSQFTQVIRFISSQDSVSIFEFHKHWFLFHYPTLS